MRKVIAFGTFDSFHLGHEACLKQAKALGDHLIVVIARDSTVKKIKGVSPDFSEQKRKETVEKSGLADKVVIGENNDKYDVIRKFRPNVIALGYDQFVFTHRLEKFLIDEKIDAKIVRMNPYRPEIFKTSLLRQSHGACTKTHA